MTPRILTIFVRAGLEAYPDAEAHLAELFARQLPAVEREVLVVDNLLPPGVSESRAGRTVIGGDNRAWEFSAIDAGLAYLGPAVWRYDLVNVVTSAFEQLYTAYLERFGPHVVEAVVGRRAVVGHIDCYNEPVRVGRFGSQHWIRTCFFMTTPQEIALLGSLVSAPDREGWFSGRHEDPFGPGSAIDDTYKKYLTDWLLGQDIGQGVTWHRALTLDGDGLRQFEQKALAIINEHLLAIRLRAAGCRLTDVTWLSAMLARSTTVDWETPWWRQLGNRDRDAIHVTPPDTAVTVVSEMVPAAPAFRDQPAHDRNAAYDLETAEVMRRLLREDSVCLDIGAHEGSVLQEIVAVAPRGRHHAFEPLPHLAAGLRAAFPGVTVHEAAVSDAPGRAQYVFVENAPAYSGLRERDYDRPDPAKTLLDVSVVRIDDVVPQTADVDFIKLDIEGGELHALKGGVRTITRCRPVIVFEAGARSTGKYGVTPEELFAFIEDECACLLSTMRRWLDGEAPYSEPEFVHNWHNGPEYYFIAYPPSAVPSP